MAFLLSLLLLAFPQARPEASSAEAAFSVLQKNCVSCHGDTGFARSYMLLDHAAMVKAGKIVPGRAEESILYKRIAGTVEPLMPQGGTKLRDGDIAIIKRWIDEGAPSWTPTLSEPRRLLTNADVISAIEKDLVSAGTETSRPFFRYFTLTNLYNAGDAKLPTYRAALFKLINSLSWDREIAIPVIIDKEQTILRIDIRDYDWSDPVQTWETVLEGYPYGVESSDSGNARIRTMTASRVPFIRADWFLAAASMPPLYHDILELPEHETDLEMCGRNSKRCLNVNVERNLRDSPGLRVVRAGFTESGVSNSNRIVERHRSPYGAYWKSHDFPDNLGDHNIFKHPLDFQRAGGEIIFNLPNGLQAYLLVDAKGTRLDQAPTNIVFNKGGTRAEIRNGLSCMSCHADGMRSFTDDVRSTLSAQSLFDRTYATSLYPEGSALKKVLTEDQTRFETALKKIGVQSGTEPIGELSERYAASVDALAAASELGLSKGEFLRRLTQSETLRQLGLETLLSGGTVKRDAWEDSFADVVDEFQTGVWIPPTRAYGERFFNGSTVPGRGSVPRISRNPVDQLSATFTAVIGKPVRTNENGRVRTYSIRNVRALSVCSVEISDVTRLSEPNSPARFWSEEDTQSFSLQSARASVAPENGVLRLTVRTDTPSIRLDRTFLNNQWSDTSLPLTGQRVEFLDTVIFDMPPGREADAAVAALRDAIAECSSPINQIIRR